MASVLICNSLSEKRRATSLSPVLFNTDLLSCLLHCIYGFLSYFFHAQFLSTKHVFSHQLSPKPFSLYISIYNTSHPLTSFIQFYCTFHSQNTTLLILPSSSSSSLSLSLSSYMDPILILFTVAATSAYLIWFHLLARKLTGPKVWPVVGSLPLLFMNRRRMHDWIAENLRATGGAATYQTCTIALPFLARKQGFYTVTCHPKNIEHILRTRFDNYPKGPTWQTAFHDLLGQGIFNSDGETWLIQRKTAALEFTTRTLRQAMARWVSRTIKTRLWIILEKASKENIPVDLQDLLLRLTFDNICGLTFGKDPETLSSDLPENPFANAFDSATEATLQRLLYPGFLWRLKKILRVGAEMRLKKSLQVVENYMTDVFTARKETPSDDLLSRFMKKRDVDGNLFPSAVLKRIALNFVLAGRDTSSVALSWFFWLVMNNPRVEEKIIDEISTVLKDTRGEDRRTWIEESLVFDEADRLVYLKAALAETLRLYPSVPQDFKYVVSDDVLPDGTHVPAGSTVTYSIYSVGRMKTIWGEDCLEFKPERWLSTEGDRFETPKDGYKFVAFNAGPRTCLGKDLAYLQMKSVASAVLLRYRLSLVPGHRVEQKMSLTLFLRNGLHVYLHPRILTAPGVATSA